MYTLHNIRTSYSLFEKSKHKLAVNYKFFLQKRVIFLVRNNRVLLRIFSWLMHVDSLRISRSSSSDPPWQGL